MNYAKKFRPTIEEIISVLSERNHTIEDGLAVCTAVIQCLLSEAESDEAFINKFSKNSTEYWLACIEKEKE